MKKVFGLLFGFLVIVVIIGVSVLYANIRMMAFATHDTLWLITLHPFQFVEFDVRPRTVPGGSRVCLTDDPYWWCAGKEHQGLRERW